MMKGAIEGSKDNSSKPVAAKFSPKLYYKRRCKGVVYHAEGPETKKARNDDSDPFAAHKLSEELNSRRYGSVTEDIKDLLARRSKVSNFFFRMHSTDLEVEKKKIEEEPQVKQLESRSVTEDIKDLLARRSKVSNLFFRMHSTDLEVEKKKIEEEPQVKQLESHSALPDVIVLEDDSADHVITGRSEIVLIDSDSEETGYQRPFNTHREQAAELLINNILDSDGAQNQILSHDDPRFAGETETKKDKGVYVGVEDGILDTQDSDGAQNQSLSHDDPRFAGETETKKDVYVGVEDDILDTKDSDGAQNQSLGHDDPRFAGETETKKDKGVYVGVEDDILDTQDSDGAQNQSLSHDDPRFAGETETKKDKGVYVGVEDGILETQDSDGAQNQSLSHDDPRFSGETETKKDKGVYVGVENDILKTQDSDWAQNQSLSHDDPRFSGETEAKKDKGVYVGVEDDILETQDSDEAQNQSLSHDDPRFACETETKKDKGVYVGVEDDIQSEDGNCQTDSGYDDLANIWKEMNVAFECCKDTTEDPLPDELVREGIDECDHTFILKDDLGYVCRICGVIQRGIETIIEYQYMKSTRTPRTYHYEAWATKDTEATEILHDGVKLSGQDFIVSDISVHPRHRKQMKPHQVAGFNFLLSNLVAEKPGGCIMAHAPGSGKTFMIISFIQSFLAKYPDARPLVVLPRGILATWKKEFHRWQIEDIPLYDFYSAKADNRSQQLEVLRKWEDGKSILFLGYKQFSSIVCDTETNKTSSACQEILLTCPSILILDEGHTPRNEDTDVLNSLKKVRTLRKVVLSGTLYQNHVKEVFNIFDLVRPRFIRWDTSRAIIRRILSKVSSVRNNVNAKGLENNFYEAVECSLKENDFKRKISVIRDLREMTSKVLHFYKGDFLDELPGLVDLTVLLDLSPRQKHELKDLKKIGSKFKISSDGSALYVHPQLRYLSRKSSSRDRERPDDSEMDQILEKAEVREGVKAKFFLNLLALCECGGEKLLVFSQYLQPLKFLERMAMKVKGWSLGKEIFVITGDSNSENREWSVDCFNTSADARVFFGSIKACGEGISLVGASRIIILDVHLNPSVTRQAIGRAFRPGQEKKVYTYRLVAADSPEEEDHFTCFKKESISKMWFEWDECCGQNEFEMQPVNVNECGDLFLESPKLSEDVKALYKR